jgi:hypothetical protein
MQLIQPDVIAAGRGLSYGAATFLVYVGLLLWAVGWRWHRFWVVFGITLASGVVGLGAGRAAGGHQVMVVGILLAVSAGMLALELARVISFVTGGVAAWAAVQTILPSVQELWAIFLAGGILGVVLYKLWTMLTTSFVGVLVSWHGTILILQQAGTADLAPWVAGNSTALTGGAIAATLLGVAVQAWTDGKPAEEEEAPIAAEPPADVKSFALFTPKWWPSSKAA